LYQYIWYKEFEGSVVGVDILWLEAIMVAGAVVLWVQRRKAWLR
jgi:hypothetical protein